MILAEVVNHVTGNRVVGIALLGLCGLLRSIGFHERHTLKPLVRKFASTQRIFSMMSHVLSRETCHSRDISAKNAVAKPQCKASLSLGSGVKEAEV
jgi:hypothetical protein